MDRKMSSEEAGKLAELVQPVLQKISADIKALAVIGLMGGRMNGGLAMIIAVYIIASELVALLVVNRNEEIRVDILSTIVGIREKYNKEITKVVGYDMEFSYEELFPKKGDDDGSDK